MSNGLPEKYPLLFQAPIYGASSGWQVRKYTSVQHQGRNYALITMEKRNPTILKICLVIGLILLTLGIIFVFALGRKKMEVWWSGLEKQRFSLLEESES